MMSAGEKTSVTELDSLILSVDCLVHLCPPSSDLPIATLVPPPPLGSYTERLAHEHSKVIGYPIQADKKFLKRFSDSPVAINTKHATDKITVNLQNKRFAKELAQNNCATLLPKERAAIEQTLGENAIGYKLDGAGLRKLFKALDNNINNSEPFNSN